MTIKWPRLATVVYSKKNKLIAKKDSKQYVLKIILYFVSFRQWISSIYFWYRGVKRDGSRRTKLCHIKLKNDHNKLKKYNLQFIVSKSMPTPFPSQLFISSRFECGLQETLEKLLEEYMWTFFESLYEINVMRYVYVNRIVKFKWTSYALLQIKNRIVFKMFPRNYVRETENWDWMN